MEVCHGDARIHGVHADADRRHLDRCASRQVIDTGLAHVVGEDAGKRPQPVHARHVDDRAFPPGEMRRGRAHEAKRRGEVHGHHRVPRRIGRIFQGAGRNDARRVHQHVDRTAEIHSRADDPIGCVGGRHICGAGSGLSAVLTNPVRDVRECGVISPDEHHRAARLPERFGCGAADAARRARHNNRLVLKSHDASVMETDPPWNAKAGKVGEVGEVGDVEWGLALTE